MNLGDFLGGLGAKLTSTDTLSQSVAEQNLATAEYLRNAANNPPQVGDDGSSNKILMVSVVGSLVVAGVVAAIYLSKKRGK